MADSLQSMTSLYTVITWHLLKSMFVAIKVATASSTNSTSLQQYRVVLLTLEERSANIKFITESSKNIHVPVSENDSGHPMLKIFKALSKRRHRQSKNLLMILWVI
jgi:hypothetical protein